jgi:hypothetical protein
LVKATEEEKAAAAETEVEDSKALQALAESLETITAE